MPTLAVIMDGNGRWAKALGRPESFGHKEGAETLRRVVGEAKTLGVKNFVVYAFSQDNWKRPKGEVSFLMNLAEQYLKDFADEAFENDIHIRIIGDRKDTRMPERLVHAIDYIEGVTLMCNSMNLYIAFNYSGEHDLVHAARKIASHVASDELKASDITFEVFREHLLSRDVPDIDVVVRTGGEERLSNFFPIQTRYAEYVRVDTLWPDFGKEDLSRILTVYKSRERRFGGRPQRVAAE